jgi:adenylylsulfate kinase
MDSHTDYLCTFVDDKPSKIRIIHQTSDRISVLFLEAKGHIPIISLISPYKDLREDLKNKTSVLEFYVYTSEIRGREEFFAKDYQKPTERFMPTNTTNKESTDIANEILVVFNNVKNKGVLNELLINKNRING